MPREGSKARTGSSLGPTGPQACSGGPAGSGTDRVPGRVLSSSSSRLQGEPALQGRGRPPRGQGQGHPAVRGGARSDTRGCGSPKGALGQPGRPVSHIWVSLPVGTRPRGPESGSALSEVGVCCLPCSRLSWRKGQIPRGEGLGLWGDSPSPSLQPGEGLPAGWAPQRQCELSEGGARPPPGLQWVHL